MTNTFKAAVCHFSIKVAPLTSLLVDEAITKIKANLTQNYLLTEVAKVALNDGTLHVLSAPAQGDNPSLTSTIRVYANDSLITVAIEGTGPLNTPGLENSFNFVSGADSHGINNNSLDKLKSQLNTDLGVEVDKIPVLKLAPDVPVYFTSCDDRIFEYDFDRLLFDGTSEFQNVRIYRSPTLGNALFLDDLQNLAESDIAYTQGLMNYGKVDYRDKEILILGGGDGALLNELVKERPKFVTMVDIDKMVLESCRQHMRLACGSVLDTLETDSYHVIVGDCIKFLENCIASGRQFDVIFNDLTDIPICPEHTDVGSDLWAFVKKILNMSLACLKTDGKYMNHAIGSGCTTALDAYENVLRTLPVKVTFTRHSAFVPSFLEE